MILRTTVTVFAAAAAMVCIPAQAPKPKPSQGAVQMPGDNGKIGTLYQLGKTGEELVFTLEKIEFANRALLTDNSVFATDRERLAIISYAVQNPGKGDRFFFNQSFSFTVVSPDDKNYVYDGAVGNGAAAYHPDKREPQSMQLKPAQKVRAIAVVRIHPTGPINKLIVQRHKGTSVLRYDLKEKVGLQKGAFSAENGIDSLPVGKSMLTVPFELGPWDVVVEKMEQVPDLTGFESLGTARKYISLTVQIKNATFGPSGMHSSMIVPKMVDEDGSSVAASGMYKNSASESFNNPAIEPGATARFRLVFSAGLTTVPVKVGLTEQLSGRTVEVLLKKPEDK